MAHKLYDVTVKTGSYTDAQGQPKGRYENIGVMMQGDNGPYLMLRRTFNPAGVPNEDNRDTVLCSLFEPKEQNQQPAQQQAPQYQSPQYQQPPQGYAPQQPIQQGAYNQQQPVPPGQRP